MTKNVQQATRDDILVRKSIVELDSEDRMVVLSLSTTADKPVRARIIESIPSRQTLRFGEGDAGVPDTGGVLTIEDDVGPHENRRVGYHLAGPVETDFAQPAVELVVNGGAKAGPRVEWVNANGEPTVLDTVTDNVPEHGEGFLPVVTLPDADAPPSAVSAPDRSPRAMDEAAIGVVLTPTNADAAFRTVFRASQRGHTVFATHHGVDDEEAIETLQSLGAIVIDPPSNRVTQSELNRLLSRTARERGHPGIVLQTRACPRIDYERTADAFDARDYEVVAIPERWIQPGTNPTVVVGIPAYNAAGSIAEVVERASAFADEVLVVDDGSRDETAVRARDAGATVIVHDQNRGYGGALKTLFREGRERDAAHLVVIDADGQHDPADIPMLVETQAREDADIVIGSRYVGDRRTKIPFVRSVGLAIVNGLTNVSMGNLRPDGFIRDTQSGYRTYSRRALQSLARDRGIGNNMGASTDILYHAHRNRFTVTEVPTTIYYDLENTSSQGSLSHGIDLIRNIVWTVEYGRPLLVVGVPGALVTVLGVVVTTVLLVTFVESGALAPVQLAVSILFAVGGVLLCFSALLMHVLNSHPTLRQLVSDANN